MMKTLILLRYAGKEREVGGSSQGQPPAPQQSE